MEGRNKIGKNNPDQLKILDELEKEADKRANDRLNYDGFAIMLDGPGGNGKTFLLETFYNYCNRRDKQYLVLCSAFSGTFFTNYFFRIFVDFKVSQPNSCQTG